MPLDLVSWNKVVAKSKKKSPTFLELDTAVKAYLADQTSPDILAALRTKWDAWTAGLSEKSYRKSNRYEKGGALDDLDLLFQANPPGDNSRMVSNAQLATIIAAVAARETRATAKRTANLVFQMTGGTDLNINMPLRYNLLQTGRGLQDAEILVQLPILVHQGAAAKTYWISEGYVADDFDLTTHGGKQPLVEGATANGDVLARWTETINSWWGRAAVIHHPVGGREKYYRLKFEFSFTDDPSKACKQIACVKTTGAAAGLNPNGTIDAVRWGADDTGPGGPICHEVGHFLGCPDEYFTVTYEGRTRSWGNGYQPDKGVMNNPNTRPLARHYRKMGQELANQFGFDPNEASIILDVTLGLNNPNQRKHQLAGHIWDGVA
jgi:hypothetical protein